ncbi:type IV toxin-antitoxin system AbiEi family antitoxin domain-containing protein [Arthrobacter sedimenti]|uniref:type IV toxin-antitoxin system AbiEi family antitoxin domain-containing protein n=1 Tax=Arthrobacter sedimenti TaxID=2694931 RepID=UPI0014206BFC|nr:type IV toxin-antitoxin system AbiEi family antitoxin domain-containing protein [Arthrobacter sedimenti]
MGWSRTIEQILAVSGGVASTGDLLKRGVGERAIERCIRDGRLLRIRRGVLALPGAPPEFIEAVDAGARLTCVSAVSAA